MVYCYYSGGGGDSGVAFLDLAVDTFDLLMDALDFGGDRRDISYLGD